MLDEMSERAQKALSGIGQNVGASAVKELAKMTMDANKSIGTMQNNLVGVMRNATSATQTYNAV